MTRDVSIRAPRGAKTKGKPAPKKGQAGYDYFLREDEKVASVVVAESGKLEGTDWKVVGKRGPKKGQGGRPKGKGTPKTERLNSWLYEGTLAALDARAEAEGLGRAEWLKKMLRVE